MLDLADAERRPLTNLALLKLVYFAHGWFLAEHGRPLVENRFEAWTYGPVVKVLYQQFKAYGERPITSRAYFFDPVTQQRRLAEPKLTNYMQNFIYGVYREYSEFSAYALSDLTHEAKSPWDKVWNSKISRVNPGLIISNDDIMNWFRQLGRKQSLH